MEVLKKHLLQTGVNLPALFQRVSVVFAATALARPEETQPELQEADGGVCLKKVS